MVRGYCLRRMIGCGQLAGWVVRKIADPIHQGIDAGDPRQPVIGVSVRSERRRVPFVLDQAQSVGRIVTPIRRRHEIRRPQGFIPIQAGPLPNAL